MNQQRHYQHKLPQPQQQLLRKVRQQQQQQRWTTTAPNCNEAATPAVPLHTKQRHRQPRRQRQQQPQRWNRMTSVMAAAVTTLLLFCNLSNVTIVDGRTAGSSRYVSSSSSSSTSHGFWKSSLRLSSLVSAQSSQLSSSSSSSSSSLKHPKRNKRHHTSSSFLLSKKRPPTTDRSTRATCNSSRSSNKDSNTGTTANTCATSSNHMDSCWWTAALSGSIAGAVATTILYPLDAAKTLRQAHIGSSSSSVVIPVVSTTSAKAAAAVAVGIPRQQQISSVYDALRQLIHQRTVYVGLSTAILGAIPSSAIYFGAYETSKAWIGRNIIYRTTNKRSTSGRQSHHDDTDNDEEVTMLQRCLWHSTAAAIGNLFSSAIFVPKEVIKQQMQYNSVIMATTAVAAATGVGGGTINSCSQPRTNVLRLIQQIVQQKGIKNGLYVGYRATVLRNIPSAALRFTLYEEFKRHVHRSDPNSKHNQTWKLYIAGALAGAMASGIMTPMDLIKTKLSTGTCPIVYETNNTIQNCILFVIQENGIVGLWTGAGSRMISSALFSAIGFGTFETCQYYFNYYHSNTDEPKRWSKIKCKGKRTPLRIQ